MVHIDRMEIIQLLVPADGVHIGVKAGPGGKAVGGKGHPLPLGQGLDNLDLGAADVQNIELDRALHPVEVVVKSCLGTHEKGGGNPGEVHGVGQLGFKEILSGFNGHLGLQKIQLRKVLFGDDDSTGHGNSSSIGNRGITFVPL